MPAPTSLWEEKEERQIRYLLGNVTPEQQADVEERLFREPDFHEELLATTDDLIRAYLVGRLPPADRALFESHFLASPRRRQRFDFLKDLLATIADASEEAARARSTAPAWTPWLAAAAVVLLAAGLYVALRHPAPAGDSRAALPTPQPTETLPPPTATPVPDARPRPTTTAPTAAPHAETRLVRLSPAPEEPAQVALDRETRTVRLEVPLDGARHPTYDAEIRNVGGESVWEAKALVPRGRGAPLVLDVPTRVLVADAYELRVRGERVRDMSGPVTTLTYTLHVTRAARR